MQRRLQDDFDKPYLDYSLHDTVYNLILDGNHKRAEQLYRDFKIPDKRSERWRAGRRLLSVSKVLRGAGLNQLPNLCDLP